MMKFSIPTTNIKLNIKPNHCPVCNVVNRIEHYAHIKTVNSDGEIQLIVLWTCSEDTCKAVFPALYDSLSIVSYIFRKFLTGTPIMFELSDTIKNLKSGKLDDHKSDDFIPTRFIKTYSQSLIAESHGLDEISGVGFRKSLEYLVLDFAVKNNPEDIEDINNKFKLYEVVNKYYTGDLKEIIKRAIWLGNDHAHYNKLFVEYDVSYLKQIINTICTEIHSMALKMEILNIDPRK